MKSSRARSRCKTGVHAVLRTLLIAATVAGAACNTEEGGAGDASVADLNAEADLAGVDLTPPPDMACTPQVQSCTDICGPVRDDCTGDTFQCGACPAGLVCDLNGTHKCITPKVSCTDLAAECGLTRDSCGNFVGCGTCAGVGQECNPDNNTCGTCQAVTCEDLGYECGTAWLGCGPASNTTGCGDCSAKPGTVCNQVYHVCDPAAPSGKTNKQICDDAKLARGVECGIITNNNGGTVDCSVFNEYKCPAGQACNTRGIANRCDPFEPPLECTVANYNCGTMPSACGGSISCGDCPVGLICNMAAGQTAGVCGPPCVNPHKTCAVDYPGVCGKQLDDTCWPKLDCDCDPSMVCSTSVPGQTGTCSVAKLCTDYTANGDPGQSCSNAASPAFPKGDGSNLTCVCDPGSQCVTGPPGPVVGGATSGKCCVNANATCATDQCNSSVTNSCTGVVTACTCTVASGKICKNSTNTCITPTLCSAYTTGAAGMQCSNGASSSFDNGAGAGLTCGCNSGLTCVNSGTGVPVTGGTVGVCRAPYTCATLPSGARPANLAGAMCNDNMFYDNGIGGKIACPCQGTLACINDSNVAEGTCCQNTATCAAGSCNTSVPNTCAGQPAIACTCTVMGQSCNNGTMTCVVPFTCGGTYGAPGTVNGNCSNGATASYPSGTGTNLSCPCNSGLVCVNGSTPVAAGATGTCKAPLTCADVAPNRGTVGGGCNDNVFYDDGVGGKIACPCTGGRICTGDSAAAAGTCTAANTCAGTYGAPGTANGNCSNGASASYPNGNGTNLSCPCNSGLLCVDDLVTPAVVGAGLTGVCFQPNNCATYTTGLDGTQCSNGASASFPNGAGTNLTCSCAGSRFCIKNPPGPPAPVASGSELGQCCTNVPTSCAANACNTTRVTNSCTGATAPCTCNTNTSYCSSTTAGVAGTCMPKKTCQSLGKTGAEGGACNDNVFYDDGSGGSPDFACECNRMTQPNNTCTNDSAAQEGTCTCVGTPCPVGMVGAFFNGCTTVSCMGG